jgi:serine/threonine protein kinase
MNNEEKFRAALHNFKEFKYPDYLTKNAQHLISKLCARETSLRLTCYEALKHPWITRDLDGELPITFME